MDATTISLLACIFSFLAVLATVRLKSRPDAIDDLIHGDCPHIPDDLKVSHNGSVSR